MKSTNIFRILIAILIFGFFSPNLLAQSTKKERNLITAGNSLYEEGKYSAALEKYKAALKANPSSAVAQYNMGLCELRLGTNQADTTQTAQKMKQEGSEAMRRVAQMAKEKPNLAAKANYNLGNVAFMDEDYNSALNFYKQALRLDPADNNARRNLRITQLKMQNQNQDNKDNKNNQDKDNKKDQEKEQEKKDDQQQNQDNQQQQQPPKQNPQQPDISDQAAEQILNAMENKENQTRARVANKEGQKSKGRMRSPYNW